MAEAISGGGGGSVFSPIWPDTPPHPPDETTTCLTRYPPLWPDANTPLTIHSPQEGTQKAAEWMTHARENSTFRHTSYAVGNELHFMFYSFLSWYGTLCKIMYIKRCLSSIDECCNFVIAFPLSRRQKNVTSHNLEMVGANSIVGFARTVLASTCFLNHLKEEFSLQNFKFCKCDLN